METIERFRCCKRKRKKCCQSASPNKSTHPNKSVPPTTDQLSTPPTYDPNNIDQSPQPPTQDPNNIDQVPTHPTNDPNNTSQLPIDASEFMDGDEFVLPKTEAKYGEMVHKFKGRSDGWSHQKTGLDLPPLPPHVTIDLGNGGSLKIPNDWPSIQALKFNRCPSLPYPKETDLLCFRFPQGESADYFFIRDYNYSQSFGFGTQDTVLKFKTDNVVSSTGDSQTITPMADGSTHSLNQSLLLVGSHLMSMQRREARSFHILYGLILSESRC